MNLSISKENVYQLLSALRLQNPTQYYTLVKMHLSFATDHATDQCDGSFDNSGMASTNRWNLSPLMRKFIRGSNPPQQDTENFLLTVDVVHRVFELIRFLNKNENIQQEGLFRKTGSVTRQAELKAALQVGKKLNLDSEIYSAHDCASVLKSFLADLPEPLLQEEQYHVHCRIAEMCGQNIENKQQTDEYIRKVKALRLVFLLLPSLNYEILKELLFFLNRVTSFQEVNKMSSSNLGTMFAPHILCPRKMSPNDLQHLSGSLSNAVAFLIEKASDLFEIPRELGIDVMEYFRTEEIEKHLSKKCQEDAPTKTSFTFVDRELTAQATDCDVTDVALAELYAYVQSLPDSAKKRKLITQFNDVNGRGTPKYDPQTTQAQTQKKTEFRMKSLGDSIKKHLFSRSVKKTKPQRHLIKELNIKRSNSDDILNTSSVYCSPELRTRQKSPKTKAKSLDNLLSPKLSSDSRNCPSLSSESINKEITSLENFSIEKDITSQASSAITFASASKADGEDSYFSEVDRQSLCQKPPFQKETQITSSAKSYIPRKRISASVEYNDYEASPVEQFVLKEEKATVDPSDEPPNYQSSTDLPSTSASNAEELSGKSSPISRAMRNYSGQQGLMMTPRSRCPIIISSSSSLSSVAIQEEVLNNSEQTAENSAFDCSNTDTAAKNFCDKRKETQEPSSSMDSQLHRQTYPEPSSNSSDSSEQTQNQANLVISSEGDNSVVFEARCNSGSSVFGGFFKHLSTSSLIKLVAKLSNSSTSPNVLPSSSPASCYSPFNRKDMSSHDDSLSTVFKNYLLSRSILTENPIDLSIDNLILDFGNDSLGKDNEEDTVQSYCTDKTSSTDDCLKILPSGNSAVYNPSSELENTNPELSQSLLYCLDGNNPLYYEENYTAKRRSHLKEDYQSFHFPHKRTRLSNNQRSTGDCIPPWAEKVSLGITAPQENQGTCQSLGSDGPNKRHLHSCSPEGRSASILRNRNGTPLLHSEDLASRDSVEGATQNVLFETDL